MCDFIQTTLWVCPKHLLDDSSVSNNVSHRIQHISILVASKEELAGNTHLWVRIVRKGCFTWPVIDWMSGYSVIYSLPPDSTRRHGKHINEAVVSNESDWSPPSGCMGSLPRRKHLKVKAHFISLLHLIPSPTLTSINIHNMTTHNNVLSHHPPPMNTSIWCVVV